MIHKCSSPCEAFDYSRKPSVSCWCRKDWDVVKIDIMKKALLAAQRPSKDAVSTGKRKLVERSPYDSFWGDGGDGTGKNCLGKLKFVILTYKQTDSCTCIIYSVSSSQLSCMVNL